MKHLWSGGAVALAALVWAGPVQAQEGIQQVRTLYASAAYEDALSLVARLQLGGRKPELEQYRVICLVALGRTSEAEKAIATVVTENPSFLPDASETSPRIRDMFARVRKALVPEIAQRMYLDGRGALERKDARAAMAHFDALVRLIDAAFAEDPRLETDEPMLGELKLLASGFIDLSRATEARPEPKPEARPESVRAAAEPVQITSPVPVKQDLPLWVPPDQSSRREFRGAVRVVISEAGRVTDAVLEPGIHPAYDRLILAAARGWEYHPALRNGVPVASEKVIEVVLKPR